MANEQRVLIYYDDVVNALTKEYGKAMDLHLYSPREILESIGSVDRVDAVEVVHGRWNRVKFFAHATLHHCSICDHAEIKKYNYCPNCGAKMDCDGNG